MSFDSSHFRQVLGHFPTGVTIITGMTDDGPVGMTIGSFTSVSLEPPLVGFLPMDTSVSWKAIESSGAFCVNVLGIDHAELCWRFAKSTGGAKFDGVEWELSPGGSPVLAGAVAWIDCEIDSVRETGDHLFVLGRVTGLDSWQGDEPRPLLFFRGRLGEFTPLAADGR